jgi:hypothetical protein
VPTLVRTGVLDGTRPLHVPSEVGRGEISCGAVLRVVKGEGRGHGRSLASVRGLDGPHSLGLCLLDRREPPERLIYRSFEILGVS